MNLQTYLMIKSAYYNGMEKDATGIRLNKRKRQNLENYRAENGPIVEKPKEEAVVEAPVVSVPSKPTSIIRTGADDNDAGRWTAALHQLDRDEKRINGLNAELGKWQQDYGRMSDALGAMTDVAKGNEAEALRLADLGKQYSSYAGAGTGALVGGAGGYAGSKWLAKKLGLKGRKALALKLLGAGTGAALLGTGGYYGGKYLGGRAFRPNVNSADIRNAEGLSTSGIA